MIIRARSRADADGQTGSADLATRGPRSAAEQRVRQAELGQRAPG